MNQEQAAIMQMQVRHNAEDLQDYLKGLESWEEEIKRKDSSLTRQKPILKEHLPPVRSTVSSSQRRKRKKKKDVTSAKSSKPRRIDSYDYNSWDKFDVDKACEEVDYQVHSSSSCESSEEEEDEDEEMKRRQHAVMEKEKGNDLFKKKKYELAVESYSKAMELDPSSAILPANRAMALLKLERYAAAEADCSIALDLDNSYVKAYLRRATARVKLKNFKGGREDFEAVLKIEPSHKLAIAELEKLDKEVGTEGMRYIRAVKRPPHLRSKKPLKRIFIEDIRTETAKTDLSEHPSPSSSQSITTSASAPKSNHSKPEGGTETTNHTKHGGKSKNTSPMVEEIKASPAIQIETSQTTPLVEACDVNRVTVITETGRAVGDVRSETTKMKVMDTMTEQPGSGDQQQTPESVKSNCKLEMPAVPQSSIQFQADWKRLRANKNTLTQYFKSIPIAKYPLLLQQSLETDVFQDIITILHDQFVKCGIVCIDELAGLTKVKRFSVAIMFLSKRQKEGLVSLFKDLLMLATEDDEKITNLAVDYDVTIS